MLVAEIDGKLLAAVPLGGGRAIADPFAATADLVDLLQARVELISPQRARVRRPRLRFPRVRVAIMPACPKSPSKRCPAVAGSGCSRPSLWRCSRWAIW